jgi:hippurate hydrolase
MNQTNIAPPIKPSLTKKMIEWRHHIHKNPECGFDVVQTADFVAEQLSSFGLEVVRDVGQSGVVGILRHGDSDRSIGLRADMDALHIHEQNSFDYSSRNAGKMHACGHDGHSAMLLGAASYLSEHKLFDGTVYFIFQPDEEHGKGAQAMIDDGLFERFSIDSVFGLHNLPGLAEGQFEVRPGSLMASESSFEIVLRGTGGHAAMPHMNTDALVVGAQVVVALQTIVSRSLDALDETAVVSVTEFITDGTVNVIPSEVTIKGDCRCFTEATLAKIERRMGLIAKSLCQAAEIDYSFKFENTFYPTVNDETQTQHSIRAARLVLGTENVNSNCKRYTISEDFSSMLRVKPGCYALLGNGKDSVGGCALHNSKYDFNDNILPLGAAYWAQLVQGTLNAN